MFCPECGQPVDPAPFDPRRQSRGLLATIAALFRRIASRGALRNHCDHRATKEESE